MVVLNVIWFIVIKENFVFEKSLVGLVIVMLVVKIEFYFLWFCDMVVGVVLKGNIGYFRYDLGCLVSFLFEVF